MVEHGHRALGVSIGTVNGPTWICVGELESRAPPPHPKPALRLSLLENPQVAGSGSRTFLPPPHLNFQTGDAIGGLRWWTGLDVAWKCHANKLNEKTKMPLFKDLSKPETGKMPSLLNWARQSLTILLGWTAGYRRSLSEHIGAWRILIEPNWADWLAWRFWRCLTGLPEHDDWCPEHVRRA